MLRLAAPNLKRTPANRENCADLLRVAVNGAKTKLDLKKALQVTRPGQSTYGKPKVDYNIHRFREWSLEKIQDYLDQRPIPYVIRPDGNWMIIDRHHLFISLQKSAENFKERFGDGAIQISYELKGNFKSVDETEFRKFLEERRLVYLKYKGKKVEWEDLPEKFDEMKKDYFRGMAWVLIKAGIVEKNTTPFSEFIWAEALRQRFPKSDHDRFWDMESIEEVMEDIFDNPRAYEHLPGKIKDPPSLEEAIENLEKYEDILNW